MNGNGRERAHGPMGARATSPTPIAAPARPLARSPKQQLPVLEITNLSVNYETRAGTVEAVRDLSLAVRAGETLGVVGESGCGKSTLAFAIMGYLGDAGEVVGGSVRLGHQELLTLSPAEWRRLRGRRMAMVYQDPQTALNPSIIVGKQVAEAFQVHTGQSERACWARALEMLERVGLPDPERIAHRYPHQLSGGQQQRVVIAMALINDPELLIMDEPTTGLDVTTEALILDLVNHLKQEFNAATLYISHNLGVIAQVCDRVAVMYAGEVVEEASVERLFRDPRHPYTVGLLGCVPRLGVSKEASRLRPIPGHLPPGTARPEGCVFAPRCGLARDYCREVVPDLFPANHTSRRSRCHFHDEVPAWANSLAAEGQRPDDDRLPASDDGWATNGRASASSFVVDPATTAVPLLKVRDLRVYYGGEGIAGRLLRPLVGRQPPVRAVDGVNFELAPGQTLALVGESGCGKTTLARAVAGLLGPRHGSIGFRGQDVARTVDRRPAAVRREIQMVFQNPDSSLNPRHTVGGIIERPLRQFLGLRGIDARRRVIELLRDVQLDPTYYHRYPGQLSGGEQQRVSIARAFAGNPSLVICDEAVSSLDVSVQAAILNLLVDLQRAHGTSYVFISHDLSVVRYLADHIGVMYLGRIVDFGPADELFQPPYHPYTGALLSAVPEPEPGVKHARIRLQGPVPSPTAKITGCPFAGRCPRYLGAICDDVPPPVQVTEFGQRIACHIPLAELAVIQKRTASAPDDGSRRRAGRQAV